MKAIIRNLSWVAVAMLAGAAYAQAAFPDAASAGDLFLDEIGDGYGEPEAVTVGGFVEGETADQALTAARVEYGYYTGVYLVLFVREGDGWRVADYDGPTNYMPEIGGDEGTVAKISVGPRTYYVFTCTEASYGSGMATEYDYYILYRIDGENLAIAFEGESGSREDYYSRWYGGEDSSAWGYGAYVERTTEFTFDDVNGDGAMELWAFTRERPDDEGPYDYAEAALYVADEAGDFAPADVDAFRDILERDESAAAKLVLANAALLGEGDVAATMEYLKQAGALDASLEPAVERRCGFLAGLADDPPEAVRMFYNGGSDVHRDLIDRYPESAAASGAVIGIGTYDELMAFLKNEHKHPRWPEAYLYAVLEALYDVDYGEDGGVSKKELGALKKDMKRYLKLTADADQRAQTLTHLADCFYHAGEFKTAAGLYEESLAEAPEGLFEGYNYLRLGDCAVATGDHAAAIGYYVRCAALEDWWTDGADDALVGYATIREGDKRRNFLDYLDERNPYEFLTVEAGDLDGDGEADIAVLVQMSEDPNELYYFLGAGEEFTGEFLTEGKPSLWMVDIRDVFGGGAELLSCRETADAEGGRVTHDVLYRYDGSRMREVGRIKTEEKRTAEPAYAYETSLSFTTAPAVIMTVGGTIKNADTEAIFADEYVWDEDAFAFVPVE